MRASAQRIPVAWGPLLEKDAKHLCCFFVFFVGRGGVGAICYKLEPERIVLGFAPIGIFRCSRQRLRFSLTESWSAESLGLLLRQRFLNLTCWFDRLSLAKQPAPSSPWVLSNIMCMQYPRMYLRTLVPNTIKGMARICCLYILRRSRRVQAQRLSLHPKDLGQRGFRTHDSLQACRLCGSFNQSGAL